MKKLIISIAILMFLVSAARAQTIYFTATDTVHNITMSLDSVYVRCNTNGVDTTLYNNPKTLEIGGLLGVDDNQSENAYGIKLSAMNFVGGKLYVMVTSPKPDNVSFLLSDLTGSILINHTENCITGANNFSLVAPGISAGMYFLTISNGFSAKTYKILGTNSGSGDISITNIGFPITNVLAGTSDFTIIGYATGKIVTVLSDTIDNFTPVGNGKDTVKFEFGDEWSKWKFRKMTLELKSMHVVGKDSTYNEFASQGGEVLDRSYESNHIDEKNDYHYKIESCLGNTRKCQYSIGDTIRFCCTSGYAPIYISQFDIVLDSLNNNIKNFSYYSWGPATHCTFAANNNRSVVNIAYDSSITFLIDSNAVINATGKLRNENLDFTYEEYSQCPWEGIYPYQGYKYFWKDLTFAQDEDVQFALTLEP